MRGYSSFANPQSNGKDQLFIFFSICWQFWIPLIMKFCHLDYWLKTLAGVDRTAFGCFHSCYLERFQRVLLCHLLSILISFLVQCSVGISFVTYLVQNVCEATGEEMEAVLAVVPSVCRWHTALFHQSWEVRHLLFQCLLEIGTRVRTSLLKHNPDKTEMVSWSLRIMVRMVSAPFMERVCPLYGVFFSFSCSQH